MPVIHANTKPLILGVRTIAAAEDGRSIIAMTLEAARQATASGRLWHCQPDITSRARDSWAARRAAVAATQKQIAGLRAAQRSQNTLEKPSFRTTHRLRCPHDGSRLPPRPIEPRGEGLRLRLRAGPNLRRSVGGAVRGRRNTSRAAIGLLISGMCRWRLRRLD